MNLLVKLPEIIKKSREEYEQTKAGIFKNTQFSGSEKNILACGDNMKFMIYLREHEGLKEKIQTIYVDPPFYTKADYQGTIKITEDFPAIKPAAYGDKWTDGMEEYLTMLCSRMFMMKDLLTEDGTCWIHLDWHVVHYVKIMMDEIFGEKNFVNEIIWQYKSGGTSKKHFARKHDNILLYSKNKKYKINIGKEKSYNRGYKPYRFKGVEEYCDKIGWHTMVNQKDIWQIDMVGRTSGERTGYATQKPVALLKRIIESSTDKGDICADFFCGASGLAVAADELDRNWICCDMGDFAIGVSQKRLQKEKIKYTLLTEEGRDYSNANFKISTESMDGDLTAITLYDYEVEMENLPINKSEKEKLLITDSMQLVDYWSIDLTYDGQKHNSQLSFIKEDGRIETSIVTDLPVFREISIRVIDVFGNVSKKVVEVD